MLKKDVHKRLEIYCDSIDDICPITKEKCKKVNRSIYGICAYYFKNEFQILCPEMFLKSDFINSINDMFLKSKNIKVLKEVKYLNNYFDYVLLDEETNNYVLVETQALDSCGNFLSLMGEKVKSFSINWKTTLKTSIYQLIIKSYIAKHFNKKIIFVCQDTLANYLQICDDDIGLRTNCDVFILTYSYAENSFSNKKIYSYSLETIIHLYKTMITFSDDLDLIVQKRAKI